MNSKQQYNISSVPCKLLSNFVSLWPMAIIFLNNRDLPIWIRWISLAVAKRLAGSMFLVAADKRSKNSQGQLSEIQCSAAGSRNVRAYTCDVRLPSLDRVPGGTWWMDREPEVPATVYSVCGKWLVVTRPATEIYKLRSKPANSVTEHHSAGTAIK